MVWLTDGKFSEEYFNYLKAKENGNLDKISKFNKDCRAQDQVTSFN